MPLDADTLLDIAFVLAMVTLVPAAGYWAHRQAARHSAEARRQLQQRGHVRQLVHREGTGPMTRLWGQLPEPTPIYLRVSNLDGVDVGVGHLLGVADLKLGDPRFDANFVVRSNHPDAARAVLDEPLRRTLQQYRGIDFSTGAISNLLGPDHFRDQPDDRDLRTLWSLRIKGERNDAQCQPLLALVDTLLDRLQAQAAQGGFDSADYRVRGLEGW